MTQDLKRYRVTKEEYEKASGCMEITFAEQDTREFLCDLQISKLFSLVTDEKMVEEIRTFLNDKYNDWDASKCADCHNLDEDNTCSINGENQEGENGYCQQMEGAIEIHAHQLLAIFNLSKLQAMEQERGRLSDITDGLVEQARKEERERIEKDLYELAQNAHAGESLYIPIDKWRTFWQALKTQEVINK